MKEVRELISKGQIKPAINLLLKIADQTNDGDIKKFIISTSARFNIFFKKKNLGIDDSSLELQKIIGSILDSLDEIESLLSSQSKENQNTKTSNSTSVIDEFYSLKSILEGSVNLNKQETLNLYEKSIAIKQLMYEKIDMKLKQDYPNIIFNRLYFYDELLEVEYNELRSVPSDKNLTWFEKSVIVAGLTIALLRQFDERKFDILIQFVQELENKVWQRSLAGLILNIYEREHILLLYPNLIRKFNELKKQSKIREGILQIGIDLKEENYKTHFMNNDSFFNENSSKYFQLPQHWIIPFYRQNDILKHEIKNFPNIDEIHLIPELLINDKHLSNSEKYAIVLSIKHWDKNKIENFIYCLKQMSKCTRDHRFDRYIRDIYLFINDFKDENISLILDESIVEFPDTKILQWFIPENKITLYKAKYYRKTDQFDLAIDFYLNYLNIGNDSSANCELARCYQKRGEFDLAIKHHEIAYELDNTHTHSFIAIARCYERIGNISKCKEYLKKYEDIDRNSTDLVNVGKGYFYLVEDPSTASKYFEEYIEKEYKNKISTVRRFLLYCYLAQRELEKAKSCLELILKYDEDFDHCKLSELFFEEANKTKYDELRLVTKIKNIIHHDYEVELIRENLLRIIFK